MSAKKKVTAAIENALSDSDYRELWAVAKRGGIKQDDFDKWASLGLDSLEDRVFPLILRGLQLVWKRIIARIRIRRAKKANSPVVQARRRTGKVAVRARGIV